MGAPRIWLRIYFDPKLDEGAWVIGSASMVKTERSNVPYISYDSVIDTLRSYYGVTNDRTYEALAQEFEKARDAEPV